MMRKTLAGLAAAMLTAVILVAVPVPAEASYSNATQWCRYHKVSKWRPYMPRHITIHGHNMANGPGRHCASSGYNFRPVYRLEAWGWE